MPGAHCELCNNKFYATKGKHISYHRFPTNVILRQKWMNVCKFKLPVNPNYACICSAHFKADDYERDLRAEILNLKPRNVLKASAVPVIYANAEQSRVSHQRRDTHEPFHDEPTCTTSAVKVGLQSEKQHGQASLSGGANNQQQPPCHQEDVITSFQVETPPASGSRPAQLTKTQPKGSLQNHECTAGAVQVLCESQHSQTSLNGNIEQRTHSSPEAAITSLNVETPVNSVQSYSVAASDSRPSQPRILEYGNQEVHAAAKPREIHRIREIRPKRELCSCDVVEDLAKCKEYMIENEKLRRKLRQTEKMLSNAKLKMLRSKHKEKKTSYELLSAHITIRKLKKDLKIAQLTKTKQSTLDKKSLVAFRKLFTPSQMKMLFGETKVRWSQSDISEALTLRQYLSKRAYVYLREKRGFPLPHLRTIQRYASRFDLKQGILNGTCRPCSPAETQSETVDIKTEQSKH